MHSLYFEMRCLQKSTFAKLIPVFLIIALLLTYSENILTQSFSNSTKHIIYDEKKCPIIYYGKQYGLEIGQAYNPLLVGNAAIKYYQIYLDTRDPIYKERFLHCINILIKLSKKRDNFIVITYPFPWKYYNLPAGWASCMSQAAAVLAFYEAFLLTKNTTYKLLAKMALKAFMVPVDRGGLAYNVDGGLWFEEYAYPNSTVKPFVLNGFLYSLIRLYQYYNLSGDIEAKYLFQRGLYALKKMLPLFDTGSWTKYDLVGTDAPWVKHELHVEFLRILYEYTGDIFIYQYYKKFSNYEKNIEGIKHFLRYYVALYIRLYLALPILERFIINFILVIILFLYFSIKKCYVKREPI